MAAVIVASGRKLSSVHNFCGYYLGTSAVEPCRHTHIFCVDSVGLVGGRVDVWA